jgi:hypothetical protein
MLFRMDAAKQKSYPFHAPPRGANTPGRDRISAWRLILWYSIMGFMLANDRREVEI